MSEEAATKKPKHDVKTDISTSETTVPTLPRSTLYVSNLNDQIKLEALKSNLYLIFSTFGEVLKISMSAKLRGQAFVTLKTVDEANLAMISLRDEPFFGKPLKIQFSKSETKEL
ncbi:U2 snRNP complex subunit MSL1 Ecym_1261 [Eremothecium cymbalariae DBVPG|uniref:RRM domain-containing protein n=1 Tax=Eremothecium cymbalariae (strain CBS 270.75 / DBVPG 7215 / KCTC 17166 / NRRL Y-17582) TaxID=931890 RepID=G8JN39_ERECY|nr:hypothetical protein Ecym_1261 [Eremothecium cymbalariae DBVPG\